MHFQVETAYSCHPHPLTVTNQNSFLTRGDLYPVIDVTSITGNVVCGSVIGNPMLTTWWSPDTLPNSLTILLACKCHTTLSYSINTQI